MLIDNDHCRHSGLRPQLEWSNRKQKGHGLITVASFYTGLPKDISRRDDIRGYILILNLVFQTALR